MPIKLKDGDLSLFEAFISCNGRIGRKIFIGLFCLLLFTYASICLVFNLFDVNVNPFISAIFLYFFTSIYIKRLHDSNRSGYWLLVALIPFFGLIYANILAFFSKSKKDNKYGNANDYGRIAYFTNPDVKEIDTKYVVNDVTKMNPVTVKDVITPTSVEDVRDFLVSNNEKVSIGGGRFSMGGHTASPNSIHIDMRQLNNIYNYSLENKSIEVGAGARWSDIQKFVSQFGLSVKIMQTYANFTVGGSLSVNVHGRYIGLGPVVMSVKGITIALANGEIIKATPEQNNEIFYGAIGGYGGLGIILIAELELVENANLLRVNRRIPITEYKQFFDDKVKSNKDVVFHNADIYPKKYKKVNAVSWIKTDKETNLNDLQIPKRVHPIAMYFLWAISMTPFGKWRREYILDKLVFLKNIVHSRNYEAGYNVAELNPISGKNFSWILQEYFVPVRHVEPFVKEMGEILNDYNVNVLNISIRHAEKDPGTLLAWANEEVFAYVLYYRQNTDELSRNKVGIWTRQLIDTALKYDGKYYLPYQLHATTEQLHQAYPNMYKYFELKEKLDPEYRFQSSFFNKYYQNYLSKEIRK
jgi:FAD/FMN-containing dehydrogenase/uncharacterized membrane protein YhaH (DUF805 family)